KLSRAFRNYEGASEFQRSLNDWSRQRLSREDFKTYVTEMGEHVTLSIEVPGLNQQSINLNITESAVLFSFESRRGGRQDNPHMKIYPIPPAARPGSERISITGDTVRIVFARKNGR
ncbi:MAG TPA: Hsp20/alpha crystallin family protein, partial [Elusimicrobiales bacterium]|nr:Hsp20/alpha crystallin family protein [Elusimicrobiales bacterium]